MWCADDTLAAPGKDGIVRMSDMEEASVPNFIVTGPWDDNFGIHYDGNGKKFSGVADTTLTLLGGKNGCGKSTLAMQLLKSLLNASNVKTNPPCKVHKNCFRRDTLLISAEEGNNALRSRGTRLGITPDEEYHILVNPLGVQLDHLDPVLERYKPFALIGDSISKIIPDIDKAVEFCDDLRLRCEALRMPAILINHINKEGDQAGMEALQHSVDAVLLFTIDTDKIRILETIKNRNGPDGIKTLYRMTVNGLVLDKKAMAELEELDENDENDDEEFDDEDE